MECISYDWMGRLCHGASISFADAGWPGAVHDQRVLTEAVHNYPYIFPRLPWGKYRSSFFLHPLIHVS